MAKIDTPSSLEQSPNMAIASQIQQQQQPMQSMPQNQQQQQQQQIPTPTQQITGKRTKKSKTSAAAA